MVKIVFDLEEALRLSLLLLEEIASGAKVDADEMTNLDTICALGALAGFVMASGRVQPGDDDSFDEAATKEMLDAARSTYDATRKRVAEMDMGAA